MAEPNNNSEWLKMRSDVYVRDNGICWICNTFTQLQDYDLGHLVDRSVGGLDTYDNVTVMHTSCNLKKPIFHSLEEALRWRLLLRTPQNPEYLEITKYAINGKNAYHSFQTYWAKIFLSNYCYSI